MSVSRDDANEAVTKGEKLHRAQIAYEETDSWAFEYLDARIERYESAKNRYIDAQEYEAVKAMGEK